MRRKDSHRVLTTANNGGRGHSVMSHDDESSLKNRPIRNIHLRHQKQLL